jgi:predicted metalloprotease
MRWDDFRRSDNVEDDRDGGGGFGGGFRVPGGAGGLGIGTVVVLGLIGWALGIDPSVLIGGAEILSGGQQTRYEQPYRPEQRRAGRPTDATGDFVAAVLGDTEDRWTEIFQASGQRYRAPKLVLFAGSEPTPCAYAQSAMGPFYCPRDERIYLDTSFFRDLQTKFRGCESKACAFAEAYVIAHEVGHHVQNQLGILPKVQQAQQASADKSEANRIQVRVELQADCLAGVWAHQARAKHDFLDPGDVDAALQTASAIGDDRLQQRARGYVVPDAFTHGTSEQRKRWFMTGFNEGKVSACNTFQAAQL